MTPFTPGPLTASQAAALNDLARKVAALHAMTASAPLAINRAAGCINLSVASPESPATGFWAAIYAYPAFGDVHYSWQRVEYRGDVNGSPVTGDLPTIVDPNEVPAPGVHTANTGYRNLLAVNRVNWNGDISPLGNFVERVHFAPGRVVWAEPTGKTIDQPPYTGVPLYVTDSDQIAYYKFWTLVPTGTLPAGTALNEVTIKADNLGMRASLYVQPLDPYPSSPPAVPPPVGR